MGGRLLISYERHQEYDADLFTQIKQVESCFWNFDGTRTSEHIAEVFLNELPNEIIEYLVFLVVKSNTSIMWRLLQNGKIVIIYE